MTTPPTPRPDPADPPADDADQRMVDALLSAASESDAQRNERIERVMRSVDDQLHRAEPPAVAGRIRPLRWLGPAGLVAAILFAMWVVWPTHSVETAQAAMARVAEALQSAEHRRYDLTVVTVDDNRLYGTVDLAEGDRFVSRFISDGPLGNQVMVIAGSNGKRYWLIPPFGPVQVSDEPFGPLFPTTRDSDAPNTNLLTLPRAIAMLNDGYDVAYADAEDPQMMRLIATRKTGVHQTGDRAVLATADVIARHDSGEVVKATFTLDQPLEVGAQVVESITFELQPDAQAMNLDWYEHKTHHAGRPVIKK